jgi:stage II sporulation protein M
MKNFFIKNYKKSWKFAQESRWFIVFSLGLFSLAFLIGFAFPVFFRAEIFAFIEEIILKLEGMNAWELIVFIFLNNLQASFMAMIFGILVGIFPIMVCVVNGYLLGFVAREAVAVEGILTMWRILPHGVFELPAIISSIGIGIKIGFSVFDKKLKYNLKEALRFFVFVVFPLLVLAAIIEGLLVGFM